jgi:glycosyltransferase involved in cell wall biosynthesis
MGSAERLRRGAVCVLGKTSEQTLPDCIFVNRLDEAPPDITTFLVPGPTGRLDLQSAEYAALAVWGGRSPLVLPDGSVASSRTDLVAGVKPAAKAPSRALSTFGPVRALQRHLENAGLISLKGWLHHPLSTTARLIPLRWKERVNRALGREFFDLTFYLRFQPNSVALSSRPDHLQYRPRANNSRRRVALITPHLGPGGAESVLMDIAAALDRSKFEILVIAANSEGRLAIGRWKELVDYIFNLPALVAPEKLPAAVYSVVANWKPDTVLIQNSVVAYAVAPYLRKDLPGLRLLDLVHSVDADWNILAATQSISGSLDVRVAVSETVRRHIIDAGQSPTRTQVVRAGVDLERFSGIAPVRDDRPFRILFAGRLDPVKRPMMLVRIARTLRLRRGATDFRFAVAGEGAEAQALSAAVRHEGLAELFEFHGHVPDIAPLLSASDLLLLPSRAEGLPVVILEAFAAWRPVVASSVGAIPELVNEQTGVLVALNSGEVDAFTEGVDRLLRDPEKRRAMGENGRRMVAADYTLEAARRGYRGLFELD